MTIASSRDLQGENVHLDTTVMTDWLLKGRKAVITAKLEQYGHSTTSRFVKSEFKKGPLQRLVYLHNKFCQVRSIPELFEAISKLPPQQHRLVRSILEQFVQFFSHALPKLDEQSEVAHKVSHDEYLREIGRAYFANLIESSWDAFDLVTNRVVDPQSCFPDMVAPRRVGALFANDPRACDKSSIKCGCREFFNEHREKLAAVLERLSKVPSPDEETRRRIRSIKEILRKPKRLDEQDCWNCGDAVVAIEAPEGSAIFNNNIRHFKDICAALNLPTVTY
jgi:hypothetical protein